MALGAYAHQNLPFEKLVDELKPKRDASRNPLFQVMLVLQNTPDPRLNLPGLTVEQVWAETATAKFDLTLSISEEGEGFSGSFEYNTDLFDVATITRMIGHFQTLLEAIVANPDRKLSEFPLLTEPERRQILIEWNNTEKDYPRNACIHQLFEAQVERTPEAAAIAFQDQKLTYRDLDIRSNKLAGYLRHYGIGPDVLVGICVDRSLEMLVGLLGILKAGGAYVPLDCNYPKERLKFMLDDCRSPILITVSTLLPSLPDNRPPTVCLDTDWPGIDRLANTKPSAAVTAENLAYVNYTSGSTGLPKGVLITHRSVARLLFGVEYVRMASSQKFLQLSTLSFDASTFEIWGALLHGATCVLFPGRLPDVEELEQVIREQGIDTLWLTASLFNAVIDMKPEALRPIKQLLVGGEALSPDHVRRALQLLPDTKITNGYGPTEGTTFTCCYPIPKQFDTNRASIPIGRPIANTTVYVVDANMQPAPVGVPGELYIGGDGLARSYLNRADLTARSFIPNPFSSDPEERLYKSGDRVKWLPDGNLLFLGRTDNQVKLRGYRIELGEIERALDEHPQVQKAIVTVQESSPGNKRLVAYVVPSSNNVPPMNSIKAFLREKLPEYMIPSLFIPLKDFPLTPSGKIDHIALSSPGDRPPEFEPESYIAPRDILERTITAIMEQLLEYHPIGIRDNFFDLGGHSLLAVKFIRKIEETLGQKLPLASLFQKGTAEHLAALLKTESLLLQGGSVVEIRSGKSEKPLFLLHGLSGELPWRQLLRHLKTDRAIYGLQPPQDAKGLMQPFSDLRLMARHYVNCMRKIQSEGPYHIGGYSFGGKVALEIAQQLRSEDCDVGLLAIVDTGPGIPRGKNARDCVSFLSIFARNVPFWIRDDVLHTKPSDLVIRIGRKLRAIQKRIQSFFTPTQRFRLDLEDIYGRNHFDEYEEKIGKVHLRAWQDYTESPYPGRVTLLCSHTRPLFHSLDPDLGWSKIAEGGVDIRVIPGHHGSIMREPYVQTLAAELDSALRDCQ